MNFEQPPITKSPENPSEEIKNAEKEKYTKESLMKRLLYSRQNGIKFEMDGVSAEMNEFMGEDPKKPKKVLIFCKREDGADERYEVSYDEAVDIINGEKKLPNYEERDLPSSAESAKDKQAENAFTESVEFLNIDGWRITAEPIELLDVDGNSVIIPKAEDFIVFGNIGENILIRFRDGEKRKQVKVPKKSLEGKNVLLFQK